MRYSRITRCPQLTPDGRFATTVTRQRIIRDGSGGASNVEYRCHRLRSSLWRTLRFDGDSRCDARSERAHDCHVAMFSAPASPELLAAATRDATTAAIQFFASVLKHWAAGRERSPPAMQADAQRRNAARRSITGLADGRRPPQSVRFACQVGEDCAGAGQIVTGEWMTSNANSPGDVQWIDENAGE